MKITKTDQRPQRFGFLLLNDFTLISLSSAVEPLRIVYAVKTITAGKPCRWTVMPFRRATALA
jgi:transcriptional regulator GlxA family with amidase domain